MVTMMRGRGMVSCQRKCFNCLSNMFRWGELRQKERDDDDEDGYVEMVMLMSEICW